MRSWTLSIGVVAMALVALAGCRKSANSTTPASKGQAAARAHRDHDRGYVYGPHNGHVIELDTEKFHAEVTYDVSSNQVGIYVLGEDAATSAPIEADIVMIDAIIDDTPMQFTLSAIAQPGDPSGKSSYFQIASEPLMVVVSGASRAITNQLKLVITIDGKRYEGYIVGGEADTDEEPDSTPPKPVKDFQAQGQPSSNVADLPTVLSV